MGEDDSVPMEEMSQSERDQHSQRPSFQPRIGDPGPRLPIPSSVQVGGWVAAGSWVGSPSPPPPQEPG